MDEPRVSDGAAIEVECFYFRSVRHFGEVVIAKIGALGRIKRNFGKWPLQFAPTGRSKEKKRAARTGIEKGFVASFSAPLNGDEQYASHNDYGDRKDERPGEKKNGDNNEQQAESNENPLPNRTNRELNQRLNPTSGFASNVSSCVWITRFNCRL